MVKDGRPGAAADELAVDGDDVRINVDVDGPAEGDAPIRYRAEVLSDGVIRTITGHVWVSAEAPAAAGCPGCSALGSSADAWLWALMGMVWGRHRRRQRPAL